MKEFKKISDFINIDFLQTLQDDCSKAMGLAFVTVDYKGRPVTKYSGFSPHCALGRKIQGFSEMCEQCDAHGGLQAAITGQPYIYRCHANLVDFAVPLILNDAYMGSVMGGQVRLNDVEERELEHILPKVDWSKHKDLEEAYRQAQEVTYEKLLSSVRVLRDMILYVMQDHYNQMVTQELNGKVQELAEERAARSDLETSVQRKEYSAVLQKEGFRYFFFVMNLLTRLAYQEHAVQTEAVIYDFADIMRYTLDPDQKLSTLGEEINYAEALLRIQKAWQAGNLDYTISVLRRYWDISCPFLIFQTIVETALQSFQNEDKQQKIDIVAAEDGKDLLIQVLTNSENITPEELEIRTDAMLEQDHLSFRDIDKRLKRIMGKHCSLSIGPRNDGRLGCAIRLRLPLKWR